MIKKMGKNKTPAYHWSVLSRLWCILSSIAVDISGMRRCHRKLWENVMEVIVKIEKTNTMTNTWGKTKTDKDKNDGE